MNRRRLLGLAGASMATVLAGCLDTPEGQSANSPTPTPPQTPANGDLDVSFELVDIDPGDPDRINPEDEPVVTVDNEVEVTVEGTIKYGSSSCGTVKLAHAEFERSQHRLDVLVVAADDPEDFPEDEVAPCTDDLVQQGYRVELTVDSGLRRVSATEHHVFGETYSTTKDLTDW